MKASNSHDTLSQDDVSFMERRFGPSWKLGALLFGSGAVAITLAGVCYFIASKVHAQEVDLSEVPEDILPAVMEAMKGSPGK